jgi:PBP1b-binding outer membrane lipoprotein LpoB
MKSASIILLLLMLLLAGCGGNTDPVNEGKDKPVPPPKKSDRLEAVSIQTPSVTTCFKGDVNVCPVRENSKNKIFRT